MITLDSASSFVRSLIFSGFGFGFRLSLFFLSSTLSLSALKLHFRVEIAPAARPVCPQCALHSGPGPS